MFSISIPLVLALASFSAPFDNDDVVSFAAPVRLRAGDQPMGEGRLYPSPALIDLDGDGVAEMIIGDLFGKLTVSKRIPGEDSTVWSEPQPLEGADGKPLKFSNW